MGYCGVVDGVWDSNAGDNFGQRVADCLVFFY